MEKAIDDGENDREPKRRPESADVEARYDLCGEDDKQCIDDKRKESEGEKCDRECNKLDDRLDGNVNDAEHNCQYNSSYKCYRRPRDEVRRDEYGYD